MNTGHWNEHLPPLEYAARFDAAKAHALELRAEAIDAFWSGLARNVGRSIRRGMPTPATHASLETSPCPR